MHHDSDHNEASNKLILPIYLGVIVAAVFIGLPYIKIAAPLLQLTDSDLYMIPVGGFLFIAFWKISEKVLFGPMLKLIDAREAATSGSFEESKTVAEQAQALLEETEAKLFSVRGAASRARDTELNNLRAELAGQFNQNTAAAKDEVDAQRKVIAQESENLRQSLNSQIDTLSREVVERIKTGASSDSVQA